MAYTLPRVFIFIIFLVFNGMSACYADSQSDQELLKVSHLKNYLEIFYKTQTKMIWPGFYPNEKPIFLYFNSGHYYALNFSPFSINWQAIESPAGYIYTTNYDKWGISKQSITKNLMIDGQDGFAYQFDQLDENVSLHVFVHERFHRYQQEKFKLDHKNSWYLDANNIDNLAYIELENQIIHKYLTTNDISVLKDYLIVNAFRRHLISNSSWQRELYLQRMEGTATYVELMAKSYFEKSSLALLPEFILQEQHRRRLKEGFNLIVDQAARWRHYYVGATLCLALDRLQIKDWKKQVESLGVSPLEILRQHLPIKVADRRAALDKIKEKYQYTALEKQARNQLLSYKQTLKKWHKLLSNEPGIYLELSKPNFELLSTSRNQRNYYLADQSVLEIDTDGRLLDKTKSWSLEFKHLPMLLNNKLAWILKLPNNTIFTVDGYQYSLADLKKKQSRKFTTLIISNSKITFSTRVPGMIFTDSDHIKVKSGSWHS